MTRRAKIIATIGPSSKDETMIYQLLQAGMDVARINFSHGTYEEHTKVIYSLRKVAKELGKPLAILQDLQGPKLRVGILPPEGILLSSGHHITLVETHADITASRTKTDKENIIPVNVPNLTQVLKPGNRILMDDGQIELEVIETLTDALKARVVLGGVLKSHKGINLPMVKLGISGLTEKDKKDLLFGLSIGVDVIAFSFVRSPKDITDIRSFIYEKEPTKTDIPIIAKIERPEALDNIEGILDASDGVMIARGDLAVETSPSRVPIIQKQIIFASSHRNKFVITATQMLDSMMHNPRPTRAESTDVANAIFDGTDAVMLSGETAIGLYPVESIKMMNSIICEAEMHLSEWGHLLTPPLDTATEDAVSIARAVRELAHDRNVSRIALFTRSGRTALFMSKARPLFPILAFTPEEATYNRLNLYWGITPFLVPYVSSVETMIKTVNDAIISDSKLTPGEQVIIICGFPVGALRKPNLILLHTVGDV